MWWTLGIIVIALVLFLVYKQRNNTVVDVQEEPQLEVSTQDNEESLPQIDIEEVTSILPNLEEDSTPCEHTERKVSNPRHAVTSTNIEWTDELREVRHIMQLAPKKRKSNLGNDTSTETKQYERYERLSVEEQYELAKQFAKLIEEADLLRSQGKLTEERSFCINAIKWCVKNGLSIIYWQCRLNQVNDLLGRHKLSRLDISPKPSIIVTNRYTYIKSENEKLKTAYRQSLLIDDLEEADRINKKALAWAKKTEQFYWKDAWIKFTKDTRIEVTAIKQKKNKKNKKKKSTNKQNNESSITASDAVVPSGGEKKKKRPRIYIHKSSLLGESDSLGNK